jgi:hypothetical protein
MYAKIRGTVSRLEHESGYANDYVKNGVMLSFELASANPSAEK